MSRPIPQPMPKGWDEIWSDTEGGSLLLDRDGNPITLHQFATFVGRDEYKFVARSQLTDTLVVITVWVGMTGEFDNEGRPLIFATGVLSADPERTSQDLALLEEEPSATVDEALRTHYRHVFESAYRGVPGMSDIIFAPFTDGQVEQLNRYQASRVMHEFTCGRPHPAHVTLVATNDGWVCPDPECGYTQNWAHAFMADKDRLDELIANSLSFMTSLIGICPQCDLTETVVDPELVAGLLGAEVSAGFGSMCMACGALVALSSTDTDGRPIFTAAALRDTWLGLPLVARARDAIGLTDRRSPTLALHLLLVLTNGARE